MGYETKIIIGRVGFASKEFELDLTKPHADGSGFEYKNDAAGKPIETGRMEHYFLVYAMLDLCKLGYQDDALNRLQTKSIEQAKRDSKTSVYYFYGEDGNRAIKEDRYGQGLWPMPVAEVLAAMKKSISRSDPYRRLLWAIALLESMKDDAEGLQVLFYGH